MGSFRPLGAFFIGVFAPLSATVIVVALIAGRQAMRQAKEGYRAPQSEPESKHGARPRRILPLILIPMLVAACGSANSHQVSSAPPGSSSVAAPPDGTPCGDVNNAEIAAWVRAKLADPQVRSQVLAAVLQDTAGVQPDTNPADVASQVSDLCSSAQIAREPQGLTDNLLRLAMDSTGAASRATTTSSSVNGQASGGALYPACGDTVRDWRMTEYTYLQLIKSSNQGNAVAAASQSVTLSNALQKLASEVEANNPSNPHVSVYAEGQTYFAANVATLQQTGSFPDNAAVISGIRDALVADCGLVVVTH